MRQCHNGAPAFRPQQEFRMKDDIVIVSACRTALCKAKRGGFKDTPVDDLIAAVLKDTIARSGVEPEVRRRRQRRWGGNCGVTDMRRRLCQRVARFRGVGGLGSCVRQPISTPPLHCTRTARPPARSRAGGGRRGVWQRDGPLLAARQRVPHRDVPRRLPRHRARAHRQPAVLLGAAGVCERVCGWG